MARKAKKRKPQMPPLSLVDQLVYWGILLVLCVLYGVMMIGPLILRDRIAFADDMTVAKVDNASVLWLIVPWVSVFLISFIPWATAYQNRKPIFGRKNFRYGPPTWAKVYPLFQKDRPAAFLSERKKRERRGTALVLTILLVIGLIPLPWSLFGRDCLLRDGSVVRYGVFNGVTDSFSTGQMRAVTLETYSYVSGQHRWTKPKSWAVRLVLITEDGSRFTFDQWDFRDDDSEENGWIGAMLQLKRRYDPQIVTCSGQEELERIVRDRNLSEEETQRLYRLFDTEISGQFFGN